MVPSRALPNNWQDRSRTPSPAAWIPCLRNTANPDHADYWTHLGLAFQSPRGPHPQISSEGPIGSGQLTEARKLAGGATLTSNARPAGSRLMRHWHHERRLYTGTRWSGRGSRRNGTDSYSWSGEGCSGLRNGRTDGKHCIDWRRQRLVRIALAGSSKALQNWLIHQDHRRGT
jgi:hypothetical protein